MIIVMKHGAGQREIEAVEKVLRDHQLGVHIPMAPRPPLSA